MATTERFMPVPAEAVWDALADPDGYGYWVVGSKEIRDAEPEWPAPGSKFHHTIGFGPTSLLAFNPLVQLLTIGRNAESLMRLEELAQRQDGSSR